MPLDDLTPEQQKAVEQDEAEQAPPVASPSYFLDNAVKEVREDRSKEQASIAEIEAKALVEGSQTEFWRILKSRMLKTIEAMRRAEATRMGTGKLDLAAIGMRSVVINEIADSFNDMINTVEQKYRRQIVDDLKAQEDVPDTVGLEEIEKA